MTAANSRTLVRLDEESAVCREVAAVAREKGWGRSARLARIRPTVRLNGVLESAKLVVDRQFRLARSAAKRSLHAVDDLGAAAGTFTRYSDRGWRPDRWRRGQVW